MRKLLAVPVLLAAALMSLAGAAPAATAEHQVRGQFYSNRNSGGGNFRYNNNGGSFRYNNGGNYRYEGRRDFGEHRSRDWDDYRGRRWGNSFSFGFYSAPRAYYYPAPSYYYAPTYVEPTYCDPNGFYDRWGYWHPDPACAVDPYGY